MADEVKEIDTGQSDEIEERIEPELEIKIGKEDDDKPEVVTMSPEEFKKLKEAGDSSGAIAKAFEGLSEKLSRPTYVPPAQPVNTPQQTPEEFYAEHADDMFDKEKAPKIMSQYQKMLMEREYGGMFANVSATLSATKKELLAAKDPDFKKYQAEVEELVARQSANVRLLPDVYDRAWHDVRESHREEIESDRVSKKVEELVNAKLKELGIDPEKKKSDRPPAYENSASSRNGASSAKRTARLPDEATRTRLEREAQRRGLDLADLLRSKGYMS